MKKVTALTAILFLLVISVHGQQPVLKGTISDTAAKQNLQHALITLLRSKDSTLYKFGRADQQGRFEIRDLAPGKYKAVISYAGYADYVDDISVAGQQEIDLGRINLITKAHLLEDVIVRQQIAAIRLKGDTLEYRADSFKVRAGASIEEMLRTVPGFQIDKDGKITANGEKIEKVLVDGEEFFGDDPTVATKNLDAAAVDKFQVYDKKSDQATFTGIDDGSKTKTINFKLKEDRKRGVFGKLEAAAGPDDKWNNSLMANAFKGKRRISFYGIMSSTGKTGLGWEESSKYGSGDNMQSFVMDDGNTAIGMTDDGFDDSYGSGIPKSWSAGLNYGNKFSEDRKNLNGSYKYGKMLTEGRSGITTQSLLPDAVFSTKQERLNHTDKYRNTLSGSYDWAFDSTFSAKLTVNAYKGNTKKRSLFYNEVSDEGMLVNNSNRISSSDADNESLITSLIIRKKFKQAGHTLSLSINQRYLETKSDGFLFSQNNYYDKTGLVNGTDTTDQEKLNGNINKTITGKLAYTRAITQSLTWEVSYGMGKTNTESRLLSYDKVPGGKYTNLNKAFSNSYAYDVFANTAGTMLRFNYKKYIISAGGDVTRSDFKQMDLLKDSLVKYTYNNFFPRANFTYKFNSNRRLAINYSGRTRQPSISQLQPVADNTNPNNILIGNPNLRQEFSHSVYLSYNDYKVLKERGINISGSFGTTANAIRNATFTDTALGKTTSQYINLNGNYNYNGRIGFNRKFPKIWGVYFNASYFYSENVSSSYVNNLLNKTNSSNNGISLGFSKSVEKKFNFYMNHSLGYSTSRSSIRPDVTNNYFTYSMWTSLNLVLPKNFEFTQDISASLQQATSAFSGNNNIVTWNMALSKKIFKDKKSEIRLSAFDILDQNKGVYRNSNSTTITEQTFETLHRYFLLSFVWNFIKNPATSAPVSK